MFSEDINYFGGKVNKSTALDEVQEIYEFKEESEEFQEIEEFKDDRRVQRRSAHEKYANP